MKIINCIRHPRGVFSLSANIHLHHNPTEFQNPLVDSSEKAIQGIENLIKKPHEELVKKNREELERVKKLEGTWGKIS